MGGSIISNIAAARKSFLFSYCFNDHYPVNGVKVEGGLLIYFLVHIAYKLLMCDTMNFPINLLNHDLASVLEIW